MSNDHLSSDQVPDEVVETVRADAANSAKLDDPTEIWLTIQSICEELQARRAASKTAAETPAANQMMQPCRRGCGELVHLENDGFHVCRTDKTAAETPAAPHCDYHKAFQYDCIDCSDAREEGRG